MSGTSMDGIDAALVEFNSSTSFRLHNSTFTAFPSKLRDRIAHTCQNNQDLACNHDSPLHGELAPHYAQAALNLIEISNIPSESIKAIANHGQTVKHEPNAKPPYSLQLGDGQKIANLTGRPVICQFRQADLAAGGQGAPLMPAFHQAAFSKLESACVVNIGGISNVSFLKQPLSGYDTGPGNCLMDQWICHHLEQRYDIDGQWARSGEVNQQLLKRFMSDDYFSRSEPKSTGTDYFNLDWLMQQQVSSLEAKTVQRTLLQLTVASIAQEVLKMMSSGTLYVCGGGAENSFLMHCLAEHLTSFKVTKTDSLGLPADQLEAIGFAWLAYCFNHNIASNAPSVTGAKKACVLGELYIPDN